MGSRLRSALERAGVSQAELARAMGVTRALVSHWANGVRRPSLKQVREIASRLEVSASWLEGEEEDMPETRAQDSIEEADWFFRPAPPDGGKDFGNSNIFATPADLPTLVRETGQNSLDAPAHRGSQVHLRYGLIELIQGSEAYAAFVEAIRFDLLREHLARAATTDSRLGTRLRAGLRLIDDERRILLLRVEDFGATGLFGSEVKAEGEKNPFAALVRNNMDSSKETTTAGGAFGLGKAVLWRCSNLSTVLFASNVISERRAEGQVGLRFIGKAELTWHALGDNGFAGPGWLGKGDPIPESLWVDPEPLRALQLDRTDLPKGVSTDEATGTSILIIGFRDPKAEADPDPEAMLGELEREIAVNFWPALTSGRLSASVEYVRNGVRVRDIPAVDPEKHVPRFTEIARKHAEGIVVDGLVDTGDVVRMTVPFKVPGTRPDAPGVDPFPEDQDSVCHLLVRLTDDDENAAGTSDSKLEGSVALVRGRGMVVRYWSRRNIVVGARRFHAVLLAGERAGAEPAQVAAEQFLRLAEPPAHNKWEWNDELREKFRRGAKNLLLELFDQTTRRLRDMVRPANTGEDDGPDELRRLLQFQAPGIPEKRPVILRAIRHDIEDGRWRIEGELHVNDRSRGWRVRPRIAIDGESGGSMPLAWRELEVVKVSRGEAHKEGDDRIIIAPGTSRVEFRGTSVEDALGVPADECRLKLDLHVEEVREEAA